MKDVIDINYKEDAVEEENIYDDDSIITRPFDPNLIDVDISTVNLGSLVDMLRYDEIDLSPDFQRASDVWDVKRKSRLIESILLGLPLPSFYFSDDAITQKLSIIDGLQRLCTLRDFILEEEKPLKLTGLQFLTNFEGMTYKELKRPELKRINSLKITLNTLRKETPDDVKYIIFQRVNTSGIPLTPQEMRHALNQGPAAILIREMAQLQSFKMVTSNSVSPKRMQDCDFANRFEAFYLGGFKDYNGELDIFLSNMMGRLNKMSYETRESVKTAYDVSLTCCYQLLGTDAFRRPKSAVHSRRSPLSKAIFDALCVNIAWLNDDERNKLMSRKNDFVKAFEEVFDNETFNRAISTGTGKKSNVECRFSMISNIIKQVLDL